MGRFDPQLTNLLKDLRRRTRPEIEEFAGNRVAVLVKYTGDVERLREAGLEVVAEAGPIVSGYIALERLEELAALEGVVKGRGIAAHAPGARRERRRERCARSPHRHSRLQGLALRSFHELT